MNLDKPQDTSHFFSLGTRELCNWLDAQMTRCPQDLSLQASHKALVAAERASANELEALALVAQSPAGEQRDIAEADAKAFADDARSDLLKAASHAEDFAARHMK